MAGPATSATIGFRTSVAADKSDIGNVLKVDTSGKISTAVPLSGVGLT